MNSLSQLAAVWEPDSSGIWSEGGVGLGQQCRYNTPEAVGEPFPLRSADDQLILNAIARLDNRSESFQSLDIPVSEQAQISDGALILQAYEKWGTGCPAYLLGSWAFALWDARERRLMIARDHFDLTSLYYYKGPTFFAFSSSLKGLLAYPGVPRQLNETRFSGTKSRHLADGSTWYEGIYRLTPGRAMTVTADNVSEWQYWDIRDIPDVRYRTDDDYLEAFLEIYTEAVRCRLRSFRGVGVTLSGGLDSGSMAVLAAQELARSGRRLPAFSSVPLYDVSGTTVQGRYGDETGMINATARFAGNIDVTFCSAQNSSPTTAIERLLNIIEQPLGNYNHYWILSLLELARDQNLGTLLEGSVGNFTVSWKGDRHAYLGSLLKTGLLPTYFQEVKSWKKKNRAPLWRTIRSQLIGPLFSSAVRSRYQLSQVRKGMPFGGVFRRSSEKLPFWKTEQGRGKLEPLATLQQIPMNRLFDHGDFLWPELGAAFGMEIRNPVIDRRVVEFCLGIPQEQYTRGGQERLLIRRAMAGRLPEEVLWQEKRGQQAADIGQRVLDNRVEIELALRSVEQSPLAQTHLDLPQMTKVFQLAQERLDPAVNHAVGSVLLKGLLHGLFLQQFEIKKTAQPVKA